MRYFIDISYVGTNYAGWQVQPNAITVQSVLDEALSILCRTSIQSTGAGRTDAGVHADQLIVHFDVEDPIPSPFLAKLNGILPKDISVNQLFIPRNMPFHARFDAVSRAYRYQITLQKSPALEGYSKWVKHPLNIQHLQKAALLLRKYEDFASFCKAHGDQKTTFCHIHHAYWIKKKKMLTFHIQANRFLRGMVRGLVGTLLQVGYGKITIQQFEEILLAKDRKVAGPNVEAKGLFLNSVSYPLNSLISHESY